MLGFVSQRRFALIQFLLQFGYRIAQIFRTVIDRRIAIRDVSLVANRNLPICAQNKPAKTCTRERY